MPPPWRNSGLQPEALQNTAPTPYFRRPIETPFGKIRPVFDGFALAETSWASDSSFATSTPHPRPLHKTPQTRRRQRAELYIPAPISADSSFAGPSAQLIPAPLPRHQDDLFARRLAESGRRAVLPPLPSEQFEDVVPVPPQMRPTTGAASMAKSNRLTRAERARAAGIPVLSVRSSVRPPSRELPPLRRPGPPPPLSPPVLRAMSDSSNQAAASTQSSPKYSLAIPEEAPTISSRGSDQSTLSPSRGPSEDVYAVPCPSLSRHRSLRQSVANVSPHQATLLGSARAATPDSVVSLAASAVTLEGRPEYWNLSLATPTASFISRGRSIRGPVDPLSVSTEEGRNRSGERRRQSSLAVTEGTPTVNIPIVPGEDESPGPAAAAEDRYLGREISSATPLACPPPAATSRANPEAPSEGDSTESGGLLGFLTGLFLHPPTPPAAPPNAPPVKSSGPIQRQGQENRQILAAPRAKLANPNAGSKLLLRPSNQATSKPNPRFGSQRQPLAESRRSAANAILAPETRQKRKDPPSPGKHRRAISTGPCRGSASRTGVVPATCIRTGQPPTKMSKSSRPQSQSTAPQPRPRLRVTPFVAQALARMPKPGEGATSAAKPVSIRDYERARELAIRKAVFERSGTTEGPPLQSEIPVRCPPRAPTSSVRVPGEATRRRAEMQAINKERRDREAAEAARLAAEEARIRAEIEAELDREARKATVFRPNPLPKMYRRR